jgi:hypothetical protein
MRKVRATLGLNIACLMLVACGGPMGPIPGGKLEGAPSEWPEDWAFTDAIENVLLETRPGEPYSVTVWAVSYGNSLYIGAGSGQNRWVQYIADNNAVVLSVNGSIYTATATTVTDRAEIDAVLEVYLKKYDIDDPSEFTESDSVLFRLTQR